MGKSVRSDASLKHRTEWGKAIDRRHGPVHLNEAAEGAPDGPYEKVSL